MKKQIALLATVALVAAASMAMGTTIVGGKHDLSSAGGAGSFTGSGSEICVYCHTPHNPAVNVPLWNRNNPSPTEALYKSTTATNATNNASLSSTSISTFCMSCHDGATILGAVRNVPTSDALGNAKNLSSATTKANLGSTLANDHPIGFSYASAVAQDNGALLAQATAETNKMKFYGDGTSMECSSCHSVHDTVNGYFLRVNNDKSNLCLGCHNK